MNERIRELAEQAKAYADQQWLEAGYPNWEIYSKYYTKDYNEKFAELIVSECIEQVWYTYEDMLNENICQGIAGRIKEHFGVK